MNQISIFVRPVQGPFKSSDSTDEDVARAETHLLNIAKRRGLLLIIGDQLTYERAFISKQLRKGSITSIERFDLLCFRLAMFHLLMAKLRKDYELYMLNMSNVFDRSTMAFIRARLSKHEITNEGDRIKKGKFDLLWIMRNASAVGEADFKAVQMCNA